MAGDFYTGCTGDNLNRTEHVVSLLSKWVRDNIDPDVAWGVETLNEPNTFARYVCLWGQSEGEQGNIFPFVCAMCKVEAREANGQDRVSTRSCVLLPSPSTHANTRLLSRALRSCGHFFWISSLWVSRCQRRRRHVDSHDGGARSFATFALSLLPSVRLPSLF